MCPTLRKPPCDSRQLASQTTAGFEPVFSNFALDTACISVLLSAQRVKPACARRRLRQYIRGLCKTNPHCLSDLHLLRQRQQYRRASFSLGGTDATFPECAPFVAGDTPRGRLQVSTLRKSVFPDWLVCSSFAALCEPRKQWLCSSNRGRVVGRGLHATALYPSPLPDEQVQI